MRAPRAHEPSPTSRVALELFSRGESSVGQVTRLLAFSRRHFIEVLAAKVGMRPKLFLRILAISARVRADWPHGPGSAGRSQILINDPDGNPIELHQEP